MNNSLFLVNGFRECLYSLHTAEPIITYCSSLLRGNSRCDFLLAIRTSRSAILARGTLNQFTVKCTVMRFSLTLITRLNLLPPRLFSSSLLQRSILMHVHTALKWSLSASHFTCLNRLCLNVFIVRVLSRTIYQLLVRSLVIDQLSCTREYSYCTCTRKSYVYTDQWPVQIQVVSTYIVVRCTFSCP